MSTKPYVGNPPYDSTESGLQTMFEITRPVSTIALVRDRRTGQARGFAFVGMSDAYSVRAISELACHPYGRSLTVDDAKPMARGGGGGFGDGRREPRS